MNYYNEYDPKIARWLEALISDNLIPRGIVDTRSIAEVSPSDLSGFTQCHFFAGIGGWSLALQLAGWPTDKPVWTGSCPCQPFSTGGLQKGFNDPRHLWPVWFKLIKECKPTTIFGEQVASNITLEWYDSVSDDLENEGYACGAADLCAASKTDSHVRQRIFWVADSNSKQYYGKKRSGFRGSSSIPSIWEGAQIFEEGQGRVDELVSRHIAERVPSYSEARSILNGIPNNVVGTSGAGNAICPQVAAEFILAYCDVMQ